MVWAAGAGALGAAFLTILGACAARVVGPGGSLALALACCLCAFKSPGGFILILFTFVSQLCLSSIANLCYETVPTNAGAY